MGLLNSKGVLQFTSFDNMYFQKNESVVIQPSTKYMYVSLIAQKAKLGFKLLLLEWLNENLKQKHF